MCDDVTSRSESTAIEHGSDIKSRNHNMDLKQSLYLTKDKSNKFQTCSDMKQVLEFTNEDDNLKIDN